MGEIRAAQEELSKSFNEAGQSFYAQSQASESAGGGEGTDGQGPSADAGGSGSKPADDVVEADYEIVDEAKK